MTSSTAIVRSQADDDANIIFGVAFDEKLDDEMYVTVIATGFGLDSNGVARKPYYNSSLDDINSNSGNYGASDEDIDILDLFKNRR